MTKQKESLSKGERTLLIIVGIFVVMMLALVYWQYTLEVKPVITVPVRKVMLPHPN